MVTRGGQLRAASLSGGGRSELAMVTCGSGGDGI